MNFKKVKVKTKYNRKAEGEIIIRDDIRVVL